jgi:hypothetical protein
MAFVCDLCGCEQSGDSVISVVNNDGKSWHYCSIIHLILHQLDLLATELGKKSSKTAMRAYNTACGVVKKLSHVIEKEWGKTVKDV